MVDKRVEQKLKLISYAKYEKIIEKLVNKTKLFIKKENKKGKVFSGIYGLPRGGLPIAVHLSHHLKLPLLLEAKEGCIIVDDISDSGNTLMKYKGKYPIITVLCKKKTLVVPDIFIEMVPEEDWIVFPWEDKKLK
jgi:hypoxanthine phosphoribosyltransferase